MFGFYALTFWYGGKLVSEGELEFGDMIKAIFALAFAAQGAGQASAFAGDKAKANEAKDHIFQLLAREPEIPNDPWREEPLAADQTIVDKDFHGAIEFHDVSFRFKKQSYCFFLSFFFLHSTRSNPLLGRFLHNTGIQRARLWACWTSFP